MVLALPPVGIETADAGSSDRAIAAGMSLPAVLPQLTDDADVAAKRCTATISVSASPLEPASGRRARTVLAVVYGSVCSLVGLSAPDVTGRLRRALLSPRRLRNEVAGREETTESD
jgi:hypothetical protein